MDTLAHGMQGGILYALPTKLVFLFCNVQFPVILIFLFSLGFVQGIWPDFYSWYRWKYFNESRWKWYVIHHYNYNDCIWKYSPAFLLHVKYIDPPFHIGETTNWWPRMWKLWLFEWCIIAILFYLLIV